MTDDFENPNPEGSEIPTFEDLLAFAETDEERGELWHEHLQGGGEDTGGETGSVAEFMHRGDLAGIVNHLGKNATERAAASVKRNQAESKKGLFVSDLTDQKDNPHAVLATLQDGFNLSFVAELGLKVHPASDEKPHISLGQYAAIESMREFAIFLTRFGILQPAQIGMWLDESSEALGGKTPTQKLFSNFDETRKGIKAEDMREVILSAQTFLRPNANFHSELKRITGNLT